MKSTSADLYSVLGVLPEAEAVVITAAYRALAQRYHPDRWKGDPNEAHERMAAINAAYSVLSDSSSRSEYDRSRDSEDRSGFSEAQGMEDEFDSALEELEEKWAIACEIYPDIARLRNQLRKTSTSLAFAYTHLLLSSKRFGERKTLATQLEKSFLERYFSENTVLVDYAARLIEANQRQALLALNRLVNVVGSGDEPIKLVNHIEAKFNLAAVWETMEKEARQTNRQLALMQRVKYTMDYDPARELAVVQGYEVGEVGRGLFKATEVTVSGKGLQILFENKSKFVVWVRSELCD